MHELFPTVPEDLAAADTDELRGLLSTYRDTARQIREGEADLGDLDADQVIEQMRAASESMKAIKTELSGRDEAAQNYEADVAALAAEMEAEDEAPADAEAADGEEAAAEVVAEAEAATELAAESEGDDDGEGDGDGDGDGAGDGDGDAEPAAAAALAVVPDPAPEAPRRRALPSATGRFATPKADGETNAVEVLAAEAFNVGNGVRIKEGQPLERMDLANAVLARMRTAGPKTAQEARFALASARFAFPKERILDRDFDGNLAKIAAVGSPFLGQEGWDALVASGGICAPPTNIYDLPNYAVTSRPVRDALPGFAADRGGVNVPTPSTIGDVVDAITTITEANDALGGTFATKSCLDLDCPAFTETLVTVLSHCREYGNLNARTWPELIAHENDLTMAAHARAAEGYLLDRIKALSVNVTNSTETLGALIYVVDAIVKARFGIITRLRMNPDTVFRVLLPWWLPDYLGLDTVQTIDGNRFRSKGELVSDLRDFGIAPSFYMDTPSTGDSQLADASQTAAAIDGLPNNVQWALYPEGAFIHVDGGSLELGLVRDSVLNETNDFQMFGETFENVARIAPAQAAYWISSDLCPSGQFPPAGTARTCE